MKKILLIFSFMQIAFFAGSQTLDSTMSYCFGKNKIVTQFNNWSRPCIFDFDNDGDKDFN
ncbi:MAG TPA: hypothetical protein VN026_03410 [Bacteroidia bacterium]|jgi:hypothetical protein|nr:hypothetical protein [Bacteroidia bacterium]